MIGCDSEVNFGQPSLLGRRLTVYDIVSKIYYEEDMKLALEDYQIAFRDAKDALVYCMTLRCNTDKNRIHFCEGCILRTLSEGSRFNRDDYVEENYDGQKVVVSRDKLSFFLGSLEELEDSQFGKVTWLIAEKIYRELEG